jgi:dipeptidyl aminopeptidase/acylaminoacyl peptidase
MALSPDGKRVASLFFGPPPEIVLLPTGPGEPQELPGHVFEAFSSVEFHPDGRRLVFVANAPGKEPAIFIQDIEGDVPPRALSPTGYNASWLSPDGNRAAARSSDGKWWLIPVDEGERRLVPGVLEGESVAGWSADGRAIYVYRPERVTRVYRVQLDDGSRQLWREVAPNDVAGRRTIDVQVAPEANAYVLFSRLILSELYLVDGLE